MKLSPTEAKRLGIGDIAMSVARSEKTKKDISHGESVCRGLIEAVDILLRNDGLDVAKGKTNFLFDPYTRRELDACWPDFRIGVELMGHDYHTRRGQIEKDYAKGATAILQGWKVFYATERQCRTCAPLWVVAAIKAMLGTEPSPP